MSDRLAFLELQAHDVAAGLEALEFEVAADGFRAGRRYRARFLFRAKDKVSYQDGDLYEFTMYCDNPAWAALVRMARRAQKITQR